MPAGQEQHLHRVLLVDDHPTLLRMMQHALQGLQLEIHTANTGRQAIEKTRELKPSVIILDIVLPDINGMEVCHRIRRDPDIPSCPVIFLSSLTDLESKIESFAQGGVDFINKPFEPEELRARVSAQLRIRELETRLQQKNLQLEYTNQRILETLSEGVIGTNAEGDIIFINQSAQQILQLQEAPLKSPIADILPLMQQDNYNIYESIYRDGRSYRNDREEITLANGEPIILQVSANPVLEHTLSLGCVITIRDITQEVESQKKLLAYRTEIQSQQNQLAHMERLYTLGEMAAGFAHEINQPLTAIRNFCTASTKLLDNPANHAQVLEYLEMARTQAERAGQVINRLRSFISKPETETETIPVAPLISETIQFILHEIRNHNINLIDKMDEKEGVILGDKIQIQQVLINLIKNSIDAMDEQQPKPQIEIHATRAYKTGYYTIIVSDNGKGVSLDMQKKLFHPFQTDKKNGMGIGLAICETIMHAHNGFISFESRPGLTCFYLNFPLREQA